MDNKQLIECKSGADFEQYVLKNPNPVILKFGAEWCPPCKALEKTLQEQVKQSNGWQVVTINVDDDGEGLSQIVQNHKVEPIPAVFLYNKGQQLETFVGNNQGKVTDFIKKCVNLTQSNQITAQAQPAKKWFECKNDEDFDQFVMKASKPVILKFGASWCPPCRELEKTLQQKIQDSQGWTVVTINVDDEEVAKIVQDHNVEPIPAAFLYNQGQRLQTFVGFNLNKLNAMIAECDKLTK